MHAPVLFRYVSFTFFSVCCLVQLALAASSLSQTKVLDGTTSIARVDAFLIVTSLLGLLAVFVVMPLERVRPSAFTSRIWVEVSWVATLCAIDLCAAAAVTAVGIHDVCSSTWMQILPRGACATVGALQAFSWLAGFTLMFHAVFVVVCTRLNSARIPEIWQMTIADVPWSSESPSTTANSVLPTYHEKQIPVYAVKPLLIVEKMAPIPQPTVQTTAANLAPASTKRASDLITTPASVNATPPLYPQFFASSQARAAAQQQQPSPAGQTASPHTSFDASSRSGRSTPESTMSSTDASPRASSDAESKPESTPSSRSSSPRIKRRPPPLNLAGLSAFDTASKSKRRDRS
jgi:hypothetical protein